MMHTRQRSDPLLAASLHSLFALACSFTQFLGYTHGSSALMLVCARLRHVAGTQWGNKKYMNMKHLEAALGDSSIA